LQDFFGFKIYPVNLSESEFTELKNFQNGFLAGFGFYPVNPKILLILIQTIKEFSEWVFGRGWFLFC